MYRAGWAGHKDMIQSRFGSTKEHSGGQLCLGPGGLRMCHVSLGLSTPKQPLENRSFSICGFSNRRLSPKCSLQRIWMPTGKSASHDLCVAEGKRELLRFSVLNVNIIESERDKCPFQPCHKSSPTALFSMLKMDISTAHSRKRTWTNSPEWDLASGPFASSCTSGVQGPCGLEDPPLGRLLQLHTAQDEGARIGEAVRG